MEYFEAETSSTPQENSNIYDTIKEAILQLNIWLTSIEDSIKECLAISNDEKTEKYKKIHCKMKAHQDCLMRIVKICQNLSMRTELSEMNIINEYIMFVMERFEKIREHIESTLKLTEVEEVEGQCKTICGKMNVYISLISTLYGDPNNNINNKNQTFHISTRLNKIKYLFNRYTEELEIVQTKLKNVKEKEFQEYNTEMETLFTSIKMIEDSMEQQWRRASEIFQPYKMHSEQSMLGSHEDFESVTKLKKYLPLISQNTEFEMESMTNSDVVEKVNLGISHSTESILYIVTECSNFKSLFPETERLKSPTFESERKSYILTVEPLKIYTHSCNIHYLLREIPIYKLATFQSLESSHTSPYIHFSFPSKIHLSTLKILMIYHEPSKGTLLDQQMDSLCLIPNSPFSTTVYKCAPHFDFLCFLDRTLAIIFSKNVDTDGALNKHMINFERSHQIQFERDYELFDEECISEEQSILETLQYDTMKEDHGDCITLLKICKQHVLPSISFSVKILNEFSASMKYPNARAVLSRPVINFVKNNFQFDIAFGSILLIKNAFKSVISIFQFDQWVRSNIEINQYRLISAPI